MGNTIREAIRHAKSELDKLIDEKIKSSAEDMLALIQQRIVIVENKLKAFDEELKDYVDVRMSSV